MPMSGKRGLTSGGTSDAPPEPVKSDLHLGQCRYKGGGPLPAVSDRAEYVGVHQIRRPTDRVTVGSARLAIPSRCCQCHRIRGGMKRYQSQLLVNSHFLIFLIHRRGACYYHCFTMFGKYEDTSLLLSTIAKHQRIPGMHNYRRKLRAHITQIPASEIACYLLSIVTSSATNYTYKPFPVDTILVPHPVSPPMNLLVHPKISPLNTCSASRIVNIPPPHHIRGLGHFRTKYDHIGRYN